MSEQAGGSIEYHRAGFVTRLPSDRLYTNTHYWLLEETPGAWRVGLTTFGTRLMGDLVEYEFTIATGARVAVGQQIGTVEGFKAAVEICCVADGEFLGVSEDLLTDITLVERDPHGRGWLYRVRGRPDPQSLDVYGYVSILDATIDRLRHDGRAPGESDDWS